MMKKIKKTDFVLGGAKPITVMELIADMLRAGMTDVGIASYILGLDYESKIMSKEAFENGEKIIEFNYEKYEKAVTDLKEFADKKGIRIRL